MTRHEFCDTCPGCRPAMIDTKTGKQMADDSPVMIKVNRIWRDETTYYERKAFIEFTYHNSRTPATTLLAGNVVKKLEAAFKDVKVV
jgi:isocitrate dehydrogenase